MYDAKQQQEKKARSVTEARHVAQCQVCKHPNCIEIEEYFIRWGSTLEITRIYGPSRDAMYRHAHVFDLFNKRRENWIMCAENLLERGDFTPLTGSALVSLNIFHMKMNLDREKRQQAQSRKPKELFKRMSIEERKAFAQDGSLPDWYSGAKGAATDKGEEGGKEGQVAETPRVQ